MWSSFLARGEASFLAVRSVHRVHFCSPAFRALLSVAKYVHERVDGEMNKGYTLQFSSPPPPFNGVLETARDTCYDGKNNRAPEKGAISKVPPGEEN